MTFQLGGQAPLATLGVHVMQTSVKIIVANMHAIESILRDNLVEEYSKNETTYFFGTWTFQNFNRNLFAANNTILTWRFLLWAN